MPLFISTTQPLLPAATVVAVATPPPKKPKDDEVDGATSLTAIAAGNDEVARNENPLLSLPISFVDPLTYAFDTDATSVATAAEAAEAGDDGAARNEKPLVFAVVTAVIIAVAVPSAAVTAVAEAADDDNVRKLNADPIPPPSSPPASSVVVVLMVERGGAAASPPPPAPCKNVNPLATLANVAAAGGGDSFEDDWSPLIDRPPNIIKIYLHPTTPRYSSNN